MPVPTPPNKELFKVTPPKTAVKPAVKTPRGPRKDTQKMVGDIRKLTHAIADDANTIQIVEPKKVVARPPAKKIYPDPRLEHMKQSPFRENLAMQKLQQEMTKSTKATPKRTPRREPANITTGEN